MLSDGVGEPRDPAIGIAITDYHAADLKPLPAGADEVAMVLEELKILGFAPGDSLNGTTSREDVVATLRRVDRRARRLLIYWTGHGDATPTSARLFTSDTDPAAPTDENAFSPQTLARLLAEITDAAQIVMILDCCGAGTTARNIAGQMATTQPPPSLSDCCATLTNDPFDV
jgi:hypothetical protein